MYTSFYIHQILFHLIYASVYFFNETCTIVDLMLNKSGAGQVPEISISQIFFL